MPASYSYNSHMHFRCSGGSVISKSVIEAGHVVGPQSFRALLQSYISRLGHSYNRTLVMYDTDTSCLGDTCSRIIFALDIQLQGS
jgi:hypothetical protein